MSEYIEMLREEARFCGDYVTLSKNDVLAMLDDYAALEARVAELEKGDARWRHARKLLTVDDISERQQEMDAFNGLVSEHECMRADDAIDRAMSREA